MNSGTRQFEALIQHWLAAPKPSRPVEKPPAPPDLLFRYLDGFRIGMANVLVRVPRE